MRSRWTECADLAGCTVAVVGVSWSSLTAIHWAAVQRVLLVTLGLLGTAVVAGRCCRLASPAPASGLAEVVVALDSSSLSSTLCH
jgi:hypothetical protein